MQSLGGKAEYDEVKRKFVELYWGKNGKGNVAREKWLLPRATLRRLASRAELALFTGRVRAEADYTLDRCRVREFFRDIITVEDVHHPKPDPEGLLKILNGRDPATALYLGDNVDDALASQAARIPFLGILPRNCRCPPCPKCFTYSTWRPGCPWGRRRARDLARAPLTARVPELPSHQWYRTNR